MLQEGAKRGRQKPQIQAHSEINSQLRNQQKVSLIIFAFDDALLGGRGSLCPPSEFQTFPCRNFGRFTCHCRNFVQGLVICCHFNSFMSPFQSCVAFRIYTNRPPSFPWGQPFNSGWTVSHQCKCGHFTLLVKFIHLIDPLVQHFKEKVNA